MFTFYQQHAIEAGIGSGLCIKGLDLNVCSLSLFAGDINGLVQFLILRYLLMNLRCICLYIM